MADEDWRETIPRCFALLDHKFALHPNEKDAAQDMLKAAWAAKVPWRDFEQAVRDYMVSLGLPAQQIQDSIDLLAKTSTYFWCD
jgi:hypothetical protein